MIEHQNAKWRQEFQEAVKASSIGQDEQALAVLAAVISEVPTEVGPRIVRSQILYEQKRFEEALTDLQAARENLAPVDDEEEELISQGLFHCHLCVGNVQAAISEAEIYFRSSKNDAPHYRKAYDEIVHPRKKYTDDNIHKIILKNETEA